MTNFYSAYSKPLLVHRGTSTILISYVLFCYFLYIGYNTVRCELGGDCNSDLDKCNSISIYINNFLTNSALRRCDTQFPSRRQNTYVKESLGHCSVIDFFVSDVYDDILDYCVLDPDINLSDHLPVAIRCKCTCQPVVPDTVVSIDSKVKQLRWDHADLLSYYNTTMSLLYPLYYELTDFENNFLSLSNVD